MVGVGAHPLLPGGVLHDPLDLGQVSLLGNTGELASDLVGCHISYTEVGVSEVGAELLGLHPGPPGQPTAQALLDVAVGALSTFLS